MNIDLLPWIIAGSLLIGMLIMLEVGRRLAQQRERRRRAAAKNDDASDGHASPGTGAVDAAIFAILGLLVAFTFSGAASRYDTRRAQIVEEANAIGTAYLRIDLLPAAAQPAMRDKFRRYTDARIDYYARIARAQDHRTDATPFKQLQGEIWSDAVAACAAVPSPAATTLFLPALNQMFDITTVRSAAAMFHPPMIIYYLLIALALVSALLAGKGMAVSNKRSWSHVLGFPVVVAITVFVVIDIEMPRAGLIRLDNFDQLMSDVRASMK